MKKRFLAISLALALCMGLMVPAFADTQAPDTADEAFKTVSFSYTLGGGKTGDFETRADVNKAWTQSFYNFEEETNGTKTIDGYVAVRSDSTFTVTNTNPAGDNPYIRIYLTTYANKGDGKYEWEDWPHRSYMVQDGGFLPDFVSPDSHGGVVELKSGESVTFTLPKSAYVTAEEGDPNADEHGYVECTDVIYLIEVEKYYPDSVYNETDEYGNTYEMVHYLYKRAYFKADDAAVDSYLANPPADPEPTAPVFTDVEEGAWYAAPVAWAVEGEITNGTDDTHFSPTRDCTQVEILTFLYRAAREKGAASAADMDLAVEWAKEKGIIGDGFDGSKKCTRSTAVDYIWQAFDKPEAEKYSFNDVDAAAGYADAVSWAVENGVTNGTDMAAGEFSPDEICTRGQIVTFLHRAYVEEARLVVAG